MATTALQDREVASRLRTMRFGYTSGMYPPPEEVAAEDLPRWHLRRAAALGHTALQLRQLPGTKDDRVALRDEAAELGVALEGAAHAMFVPLGVEPTTDNEELRRQLQWAAEAGLTVVRSGYGRLTLETTRFAAERNLGAQLEHVARCLRVAGTLAEDAGVPVAAENHCDFTGRELAEVLRSVGSDHVGCALDTANGYTVFCDPNEDIEALAEFAFTTHMKDMRMFPSPVRGMIPIIPRGVRLGEGHIDFPRALRLLAERSPRAEGLHLIIETGWETFDPGADIDAFKRAVLEEGVEYLRDLVHVMTGDVPEHATTHPDHIEGA